MYQKEVHGSNHDFRILNIRRSVTARGKIKNTVGHKKLSNVWAFQMINPCLLNLTN